jgi:primosomal protein N' (replication factor Y) (superfamily II helicase)
MYFKLMKLYNATMHYVEILVADQGYHGNDALTYESELPLPRGSLAFVPLRNKQVLGVVTKSTDQKPSFTTKPVSSVPALQPLPLQLLDLLDWMRSYYPAPLGVTVQQLLPRTLPKRAIKPISAQHMDTIELPILTNDQEAALKSIEPNGISLLHGDTGTGKTRVYIELAKQQIEQGKSAIVLTPEIGLTSQLSDNFRQVFGNRVVVVHSQLSESVRQKLWATVLNESEPVIIIGPRSALFSPVKNLGIIIIDESHETAYKQDQSPYYNAIHVASKLGALWAIPVILGSATPALIDYYVAAQKNRPIIRMTTTAANSDAQRSISVVDLKDREKFTRKSHLSDELIRSVKETLARGEQALLFLNRRGTARVVLCDNCGWQAVCPHCDLPLVYHSDTHNMRCHSCDFRARPPFSCPDCQNTSVVFKSVGTKAIEDEVARLFPEARIKRFDTDNKKEERIENHYEGVRKGEVDILIGTQTLAKGLDLPNLSLVGVILADTSLYVPDFSSQERTYQLLSQVVGRVGRGHRDSNVVIQTYNPSSPLIKAVLANNWLSFYNDELREREQFMFPPFCFMAKIWCRRATQKGAQQAAQKLADQLRQSGLKLIVEGPAPSFHERVHDKFEWQLILKSKQRSELLRAIEQLPANWQHDIDPMNLL